MTLEQLLQLPGVTAAALARDVGCHRSYITRAAKGDRQLSTAAAIKIWRARGVKLGPIASATDPEIKVLERLGPQSRAA
jgi:hypothetical protein